MSKPETYQAKILELYAEQARELRRIGRETAELRKTLNRIFLIMKAKEIQYQEKNGNLTPTPASSLETD